MSLQTMAQRSADLFAKCVGHPPHCLVAAPGRVNLIGEHTDYNDGFVLPMAIDLECHVAAAPSNDGWLRVYSEQLQQGSQFRVKDLRDMKPRGDWSDRIAGIAWELARCGFAIHPAN